MSCREGVGFRPVCGSWVWVLPQMIRRFLFGLLCFAPFAAAQWSQLQFGPQGASFSQIILLGNDRMLVGSEQVSSFANPTMHTRIALADLDLAPGSLVASLAPGGNGNDVQHAAAVDAKGNIWVVGETDSDDFPLVNPIVAQKVPYRRAGFVMELDSTGSNLLFSTYLAGQQKSTLSYASRATTLAIDSGGNVYVGGQTDESDFPTTVGAFVAGNRARTISPTPFTTPFW